MALVNIIINADLSATNQKLNLIMGKLEDLLAKQDAIDNAIEEVKLDLDFIKGQLGGNPDGLTADQVATLEARVDGTLSRLQALDAETDSTGTPV